MPSRTSGPTLGARLAEDDDDDAGEGGDRARDRAAPICSSCSKSGRKHASRCSGAMKVSAIAWASGTRPMPQKNRTAMTVTTTPRADVDRRGSCGSAMSGRRGK